MSCFFSSCLLSFVTQVDPYNCTVQWIGKLEHLSFLHGWKEQFQDITGLTQGRTAGVQLSLGYSQVFRCQSCVISINLGVREHRGSMTPSSPQLPNFLSHLPKLLASLLTTGCEEKPWGDDDSCLTEGRR